MNTEKRDFDKEAVSWDENSRRIKLAKDLVQATSKQITLTPQMDVLDFGCGTGLITLQIQPFVRTITGADSSNKMIDIFKGKIAELGVNNIKTVLVDLDKGDTLEGHYDLVMSHMTLHHIKDIEPLFRQFYKITAPSGHLCIADLDLDDGQFHDDNTGVFHFGFDRNAMRTFFSEAGFVNVRDIDAAEMVKPTIHGEKRRFTVFLMTAQKRSAKE